MILYQLKCSADHQFEAWFRDSAAFDTQAKRHQIECPICGDAEIGKAPMAPHIAGTKSLGGKSPDADQRAGEVARRILAEVGRIQKHVEENCDDVGDRFAVEARRIHYGETEERGIYGSASEKEANDLADENIQVWRFPRIRRKHS